MRERMVTGTLAGLSVSMALIVVLVTQTRAHAALGAGTISGKLNISCTAALPVWPVAVVVQGGTCPGTAIGVIAGIMDPANSAPFGASPYTLDCSGSCPFAATFNYVEVCPVLAKHVPPIIGFATGVGTIGPGPVVTPLVPAIRTATLTVPFSWIRLGVWAIFLDGKLGVLPFVPQKFAGPNKVLTMAPPPVANPVAMDSVGGGGLGIFLPFLMKNNIFPPLGPIAPFDCGQPGPQQATVAAFDFEKS